MSSNNQIIKILAQIPTSAIERETKELTEKVWTNLSSINELILKSKIIFDGCDGQQHEIFPLFVEAYYKIGNLLDGACHAKKAQEGPDNQFKFYIHHPESTFDDIHNGFDLVLSNDENIFSILIKACEIEGKIYGQSKGANRIKQLLGERIDRKVILVPNTNAGNTISRNQRIGVSPDRTNPKEGLVCFLLIDDTIKNKYNKKMEKDKIQKPGDKEKDDPVAKAVYEYYRDYEKNRKTS